MFTGSRHHPYLQNFQRSRSPLRVPQRRTHASPSPLVNTGTRSRDPPPGWRVPRSAPVFEDPVGGPTVPNYDVFERPSTSSPAPVRGFNAFGGPCFEIPSSSPRYTRGFHFFGGPMPGQPSSSQSPSPLRNTGPDYGPHPERRTSPNKFNISPIKPFTPYPQIRLPKNPARPTVTPAQAPDFPASESAPVDRQAGTRGDQPGGVKRTKHQERRLFRTIHGATSVWDAEEIEKQLLKTHYRYGKWKEVGEVEELVSKGARSKEEANQDNVFLKEMANLALDLAPNTYFDDYLTLIDDVAEDRKIRALAEAERWKKSQEERAAAEAKEKERIKMEEEERQREAKRLAEEERKRLERKRMKEAFRKAVARQREARARAERERLAREEQKQREREEREERERREREECRRLEREEAAKKEVERIEQQFTLYDAKWAAFKSSDVPALDFSQLPWPTLDFIPTGPADITYERLQAFVFHPLRPYMEGKSRRDKVKMDVLKWHPDKFDSKVLGKVIECQRSTVMESAGAVARILTQMLSEEIAKEAQEVHAL